MRKNNAIYDIKEITKRIESYCSLQDRCKWEIEKKLKIWGIDMSSVDLIINNLILEKFIDEKRYSESFCRGKFRIKKWGKRKISNELRSKKISETHIKQGISQINDEEYQNTLLSLIQKKKILINVSD